MAFGRKSNVKKLEIANSKNPQKPIVVLVQGNKNYGICDILLVTESGKKVRMTEILSVFQGRQFNDEYTMEHLYNVLDEIFNSEND